jgi:hypothetical protein
MFGDTRDFLDETRTHQTVVSRLDENRVVSRGQQGDLIISPLAEGVELVERGQAHSGCEEDSLVKTSFFSRRQPFRVRSLFKSSDLASGHSLKSGFATPCWRMRFGKSVVMPT